MRALALLCGILDLDQQRVHFFHDEIQIVALFDKLLESLVVPFRVGDQYVEELGDVLFSLLVLRALDLLVQVCVFVDLNRSENVV